MTCEVAVMNKEAIALAADSAVTSHPGPQDKIFNSVNKIFMLSDQHPIAVMMYGSAQLTGIPWEIVVKLYSEELNGRTFPKLKDYYKDFIRFIKKNTHLFPADHQEELFGDIISALFLSLKEEVIREVRRRLYQHGYVATNETRQIVNTIIEKTKKDFKNKATPANQFLTKKFSKQVLKKYRSLIQHLKKGIFQNLPIDKKHDRYLDLMAMDFLESLKNEPTPYDSGIVFAGFGKDDIFPRLYSFESLGIINNQFIYTENQYNSKQISKTVDSGIVPFAQDDMIASFMDGIHPNCRLDFVDYVSSRFKKILEKVGLPKSNKKAKLLKKIERDEIYNLEQYLEAMCKYGFSGPTMEIVSDLPKYELALMAETLVSLTSFRRKISEYSETVGGPIDVVVISKMDGFKWIKKKSYFDPDLNYHSKQIKEV